ncbi:hypothetical protein DFH08DRAFT_929375 [Mycena albidolilacea]|uniref:BTB domain-containing protein n=1 Tax=Mycena albidolilacea TaxID=1033008 RepID=A0AAD7AS24_9AGAR|nr:hypothetical protein DFH08DRAFT_929375 [Mycena albidolilacea]
MDDAPPAKRRRTDDADAPEMPLVRSTEYWFDDGNIILQVESTQFRLTKSMLSMHSTVFRDMFMMPLPADEPTVENCPVVVLSGDSPQDWIHLLGAMYPKCLIDEVPSLELIAAILRLSKKYDFSAFHKDCIRRLKTEFPTTLEEYDALNSWACIKYEEFIYFDLMRLAKEIGLHSILPLVYCVALTMERDGYIETILDPEDASVSPGDRLACILGVAKLLILQSHTTMAWLALDSDPHIPSARCIQPLKCVASVKEVILDLSKTHFPHIWVVDYWNESWDGDMCVSCRSKAKEVFEAGRKACWDKLPGAFGLPAWDKLKSLDLD